MRNLVDFELEESRVKAVVADFGLDPRTLVQLKRESRNASFLVETTCRSYVLKRLAPLPGQQWIAFQARLLDALAADGFPVEPLIRTPERRPYVFAHGAVWQLKPFVEGRPITDGAVDEVEQAAAWVARLHAWRNLDFDDVPPTTIEDVEWWLSAPFGAVDALMEQISRTGVVADLERLGDAYGRAVERARSDIDVASYGDLPRCLTHGEPAGSNFVVRNGSIVAWLDWDAVTVRPRVYDLARACVFLARHSRGSVAVRTELAVRVLAVGAGASPLTADEQAALVAVLELYFVPTPSALASSAARGNAFLEWYLRWTSSWASTIRASLAPLVDSSGTRS